MTMLDHISSVCQRCYYQLRQIRRVRKSLSAASKLLLVLASVHSRLDYCNSVLHSLPWSRLQLLQSVLNSGSAIDSWPRAIWSYYTDSYWLALARTPSVFLTRYVCLCSSVWKAWPLPIFLICVGTAAVVGRSGLRSAARGDLVVPGHRTEWGSRSFAVAGPKCWNKLPVGLRDLSVGPETFARHLKTHLFRGWFFWLGTHFWVCITFCRVRHNVMLIIIIIIFSQSSWAPEIGNGLSNLSCRDGDLSRTRVPILLDSDWSPTHLDSDWWTRLET